MKSADLKPGKDPVVIKVGDKVRLMEFADGTCNLEMYAKMRRCVGLMARVLQTDADDRTIQISPDGGNLDWWWPLSAVELVEGIMTTPKPMVKVQCMDCDGESEVSKDRVDRSRCDYSIDDDGTECGGRLVEIVDAEETKP